MPPSDVAGGSFRRGHRRRSPPRSPPPRPRTLQRSLPSPPVSTCAWCSGATPSLRKTGGSGVVPQGGPRGTRR